MIRTLLDACRFILEDPGEAQSSDWLAFALCDVTAHLALDLVDEEQVEAILNDCEEHWEEGS